MLVIKKYWKIAGVETFLTGDEKRGEGCHSICIRKENNTDMQLWKLEPKN
jgi:hypothetical protein